MKKTDEGEEEVKKCSKKTVGLEFHLPSIVSINLRRKLIRGRKKGKNAAKKQLA